MKGSFQVVLELGVQTKHKELLEAKAQNDVISADVLALTRKHEIPGPDVQLTDLDVSPDYGPYNRRQSTPVAYTFQRSIEIRLTDFGKIEPLLADAFDAGLSDVRQLHFRVSNQRQHQFEARKLAVTYAREKAEHLTELTGMKLGAPIRIEEDVEENWDARGFASMAIASRPRDNRGPTVAAHSIPVVFTAKQQAEDRAGHPRQVDRARADYHYGGCHGGIRDVPEVAVVRAC